MMMMMMSDPRLLFAFAVVVVGAIILTEGYHHPDCHFPKDPLIPSASAAHYRRQRILKMMTKKMKNVFGDYQSAGDLMTMMAQLSGLTALKSRIGCLWMTMIQNICAISSPFCKIQTIRFWRPTRPSMSWGQMVVCNPSFHIVWACKCP